MLKTHRCSSAMDGSLQRNNTKDMVSDMDRRDFFKATGAATLGVSFGSFAANAESAEQSNTRGAFSTYGNQVSIYTGAQVKPTRIFHITDTHMSMDDKRGEPYREFSKRMALAYRSNSHYLTGEKYSARESFTQTLALAKEEKADFLALTGDLFSFPSLAAVEWTLEKLEQTNIPYAYVAGNHDWHYEGMKGSAQQLRDTWISKHLSPMYQGNNPLYAAYNLNKIRFVCIDNSTYEVLPEQLEFFRAQVATKKPLVLLMHIPLYMPGRSMGFGCGNPHWGEKSDYNYKIERREKWRKGGHTQVTMDFHDEVFKASNLLSVMVGHVHAQSLDIKNGIPQIVSSYNATGYYADVRIETMS